MTTEFTPARAGRDGADESSECAPGPPLAWASAPSSRVPASPGQGPFARAAPVPFGRIGRYEVRYELGRGGMGVTYVAYDEELDRRVAIKLVRADLGGERAQRRLRHEARALARLAHPNIVAVHDVGRHGPQTFVAMEFVPGEPLGAWLAARRRPWREVVEVFRQAGEGLRAAHAAGVVHRDVKPQNFILGDDGRVRVLDFGLARLGEPTDGPASTRGAPGGGPASGAEPDAAHARPVEARLTDQGRLLGTLAYMAPEQLRGEEADARGDQFSLCASLFEALYGRLPFRGATPFLRLAAIYRGALADVPRDRDVPAWLHAAVVRGLAYDPAARWPSLDALLAALTPRPARAPARVVLLASAALALAGGALGARLAAARAAAAACTGARAQLDEAWGPARRAAVGRAVRATGASYAADAWQRAAALLDRYADDWAAAYAEACEATTVRGEQSQAMLDRRMGCLRRRRRALRALAVELERVDAASLAGAVVAAANLPPVAACADPPADVAARVPPAAPDVAAPPPAPDVAARAEAVADDLDRAEWLLELGKYDEGRRLARAAVTSAEGAGDAAAEARARVQLGRLQLALGAHDEAEDSLKQGHMLARVAGEHETALQAATQLVHLEGQLLARAKDADDWGRHVRAELPWVDAEARRADALNTLGALALRRGDLERASELCDRALALWQRALGPDHLEGTKALNNLGLVQYARGDYARAADHFRRVVRVREGALGGEHPGVAFALENLGGALRRGGEHAAAADHFARALALSERVWGAAHPYVADPPLIGLALSYADGGRPAEALAPAERALAILERHGADPAGLAEARFAVARALAAVGHDRPRALALARLAHDALRSSTGAFGLVGPDDVRAWLAARADDP
jgi:tetratricopeptide (TPR) repeat protein/predicted Ser/Thr protein kinase